MTQINKSIKYFQYCRKSSEAEDRQAASIGDQVSALKNVADKEGLHVVDIFTEEKSSKDPGRPVFNEMLARIHAGEADGNPPKNVTCYSDNIYSSGHGFRNITRCFYDRD